MSIKLIVVDVDSTFLSDQKTYDRKHFMAQYRQMKEQRIRFVAASGNQCYQLISLFPELANKISFVAKNGGWVIGEGEDAFSGKPAKNDFHAIVDHLPIRADIDIIARDKNSAYTLKQCSDKHKDVSAVYYHRLEFVDSFDSPSDVFFKFGLSISDGRTPQVQTGPHEAIDDIMVPVHTGYGSIDLIIPGVHKANGLHLLQQRWNISDDGVVVFGDGGNDIEMPHQAGFNFTMVNAHGPVTKVAKYRVSSNNEERVPGITDRMLKNEAPFTH